MDTNKMTFCGHCIPALLTAVSKSVHALVRVALDLQICKAGSISVAQAFIGSQPEHKQ